MDVSGPLFNSEFKQQDRQRNGDKQAKTRSLLFAFYFCFTHASCIFLVIRFERVSAVSAE